jgi:hypothetical protein
MKLPMAAFGSDQIPAVVLNQVDHIFNFHNSSLLQSDAWRVINPRP